MPLTLNSTPESPNIRALAQWRQERLTGLVGVTVTLQQKVDVASGILLCWKNGTLLDPTTVTPSGQTLTLGVALIAGDVFVTLYKARI
jgi:hypothetical protein